MDTEKLTPLIEELKQVLQNKATEDDIIRELRMFLDEYAVGIEAAKRAIIKKYGGSVPATQNSGFVTGNAVSKKIGELTGMEQNVDILAKVIFSEQKVVKIKGVDREIVSGIIGDSTGTASFTVWDGSNHGDIAKGQIWLFRNAYTKRWNDRIQVNMGKNCIFNKKDEMADDPSMQLAERPISYSSSVAKIADLREGIGNVSVTGKIVSVEARNITVKGEPRVVFSGIIADETGKVQFSAWNDFGLANGDTVSIKNAYIRSWNGIPQLNFGDKAEINKVDDTFGDLSAALANKKTVGEILKSGGGMDIETSGTIIELQKNSGLIRRCPQCNRSTINGECQMHGTVEPTDDLRMKITIDDGSGAISAIVGRELTERLTGITLAVALDLSKARGESEIISKSIAERVVMKHIAVRGNVMKKEEFGPMMIVKGAEFDEVDVKKGAEELLAKVEEVIQ